MVEMEQDSNYDLHSDRAPKRSHYEFVLESWIASELEQERAEDWILHIMHLAQTKNGQHLLPRQIFITKLLERLGNSGREKAAYHTERLFRIILDVEKKSRH